MTRRLRNWLGRRLIAWLNRERESPAHPLSDFERLCDEIRPCDVLLVEGRSAVSNIIKTVTQSPWSHSAIYLGRLRDIPVTAVRKKAAAHTGCGDDVPLVAEAILGRGTILEPLEKYHNYRLRLCRPRGLAARDRQRVLAYVVERLGTGYDVRQLIDLARFLFPYGILPRRWRSSLFVHNAGPETRTVCSTLLAEAFASVRFPILPVILPDDAGGHRIYRRNTRLFTPQDFDFSPYFDILKFPIHDLQELASYHLLPWAEDHIVCNDSGECFTTAAGAELEGQKRA